MNWDCRVSKEAAKEFRRLPRDRQEQIGRAIEEMRIDPMSGDVLRIKSGRFQGAMRKRCGRYRIIFRADTTSHVIEIAAILIRSEKTYK